MKKVQEREAQWLTLAAFAPRKQYWAELWLLSSQVFLSNSRFSNVSVHFLWQLSNDMLCSLLKEFQAFLSRDWNFKPPSLCKTSADTAPGILKATSTNLVAGIILLLKGPELIHAVIFLLVSASGLWLFYFFRRIAKFNPTVTTMSLRNAARHHFGKKCTHAFIASRMSSNFGLVFYPMN